MSGESYFLGFFSSGEVVESSEESDDLNVLLLHRLLKNLTISHHAKCKVCGQSHQRSLLRHYLTHSMMPVICIALRFSVNSMFYSV